MNFDFDTWPRREIYEFFSRVSQPFYSVTFRVDVTRVYEYVKPRGLSFYYALTWLVTRAMNRVPEFLLTIRGGQVRALSRREPSFTDLRPGSDCFYMVTMTAGDDLDEFCREAKRRSAAQDYFMNPDDESDNLIYISCAPWLDITGLTNERDFDADDAVPRIAWGKYTEENGRLKLGMSIEINHRLIDGIHIGQFAAALDDEISKLAP
ncbi:MAG: chloramphenicol acetyltransferase [Oscillospiraceae bacterium]|nr:chloramphenicol acetyltransferase [Oscillospiraceae bacterium]